jgi:UDP-glucose 4-epimerase
LMRILLTGGSSFTGSWFAQTLASRGHQVTAVIQRDADDYDDGRAARLAFMTKAGVELAPKVTFGREAFMSLIEQGFDVLCHHAADVTNYRSMDFDISAAVSANTLNLKSVIERGKDSGIRSIVLTGSVFEPDEGVGEPPLEAFSPYGLSKALTWQIFEYWADICDLQIGKFVIPNPFGPLEEPRFCAYLMRCWANGECAEVKTPNYIRDNIPIDLLAQSYVGFVEGSVLEGARCKVNPSGYVESQGAFAQRFAHEIGSRLKLNANIKLAKQVAFEEPLMRVNCDYVSHSWNESAFWDQLADYYRSEYLS